MAGEASGARGPVVVIDVWSDVMCPFCYLGDTTLEAAVNRFEHRDQVEIRYHAFLLEPGLPADKATDLATYFEDERGFPRAQSEQMNAQLTTRGREAGLDYRFDRALVTNTRRAHQLSHFAAEHGRQQDVVHRLFRAFFTDGLNVGDIQVLADIAAEAGLDRAAALAALESGEFAGAVDADLAEAQSLGISGVPFFVFNRTLAVSGAQSEATFLQALEQSLATKA